MLFVVPALACFQYSNRVDKSREGVYIDDTKTCR